MPSTPASTLHHILTPRPPRLCLLPIQSVWQPAAFHTPRSVRARLNSSITQGWKGTSPDDHTVDRRKKGDTTDPTVEGAHSGMKDREESKGIARDDKPQAATERGGVKHGKKAKEEHPKAPEPIIGMNDERAQKGH
ncbi:hypothetical protein ETB97_001588 [Aspergillus alliaceus]|uniref:Uncharacterized protein n=1 Tax=Petromyces alliaceus TaxID=209559 RepID=A0A5N6G4R9_PETAA|nr:uncharacterized protein BDW43DRAFT_307645 [Aspergillus alliaceus]KAB8237371.1 hypothetical protein BDW43DRAFT_307645 [Aspergillus alliaceus]KAE8391023.1 hypothetical protein BDV23DRAFT_153921 [Aspergillus alliaceus]KAF5860426.1 hypothetical protein ETB97_001588 [Aspergillus burnettii]